MSEVYIPMTIKGSYDYFEEMVRFNYEQGIGTTDSLELWTETIPAWNTIVTVVE
jgi:hypothetical protein